MLRSSSVSCSAPDKETGVCSGTLPPVGWSVQGARIPLSGDLEARKKEQTHTCIWNYERSKESMTFTRAAQGGPSSGSADNQG